MFLYLLLGVFTVTNAIIVRNGTCPVVEPVHNFTVTADPATWYEIYKYPTEPNIEMNGNCSSVEYSFKDGKIYVKNSNIVNNVKKTVEGTARVHLSPDKRGNMTVDLKFGKKHNNVDLIILAIDYVNYVIAYTCQYNATTDTHEEGAWVASQSKVMPASAKAIVDNFIATSPVLVSSDFIHTDFSEEACSFTNTIDLSADDADDSPSTD